MVLVLLRTVLLPVSVMAGAEAWFVEGVGAVPSRLVRL